MLHRELVKLGVRALWGWSKNTKFLQIIGCFSPNPPKSANFDPPHELTEFRIGLGGLGGVKLTEFRIRRP